ncbi:MAG TPA: C1 family peptidase [Polyangiaceae bacterium]|nr:C1 family peptidase [Polyangiaceae bacterium]
MRPAVVASLSGCLMGVLALVACERSGPAPAPQTPSYQGPRPGAPPPAPSMSLVPGSPLPAGWIWPFDVRNVVTVFNPLALVRPLDVARLLPYQGQGSCAPAEVAPSVWFSPDCGFTQAHRITGSQGVPAKALSGSMLALPAAVDLRASGLDGPVKYQQMVGVCWSFALSTLMDNALRRAGRTEVMSPMHVLSSSVWDDLWQKGRSERNITLESVWPYDPVKACKLNESASEVWCDQAYHVQHGSWRSDPVIVAERERANLSGAFHFTRVEQLQPSNTDQLAAVIAQGQAVYLSFQYNRQAWGAIGDSNPVIPDYVEEQGGHAVVGVGYRQAGPVRQFLLHNSWSPEWREGGYAWISEAMIRAHVRDAFVVELNVSGGGVTPAPATTGTVPWPFPFPMPGGWGPPPTSDCPSGQARDVVFGTCVAACPAGIPPVAGICAMASPGGTQGTPPSGCPAGQVVDWLTQTCSPQCKNGLPPIGGQCLP